MLPPCNVNYILHFCLCQVYIAYLIYTLLLQLFCPFYERAMQIVNIISIQHFGCFTNVLTMQGKLRHQATLGSDPRGNLIRLDNALAQMPQRLKAFQTQLDETYHQQEAAKVELGKLYSVVT